MKRKNQNQITSYTQSRFQNLCEWKNKSTNLKKIDDGSIDQERVRSNEVGDGFYPLQSIGGSVALVLATATPIAAKASGHCFVAKINDGAADYIYIYEFGRKWSRLKIKLSYVDFMKTILKYLIKNLDYFLFFYLNKSIFLFFIFKIYFFFRVKYFFFFFYYTSTTFLLII